MAGGKPRREVVPMQFNLPLDIRTRIARIVAIRTEAGAQYMYRTAARVVEDAIRALEQAEVTAYAKTPVHDVLVAAAEQDLVQTPKGDVPVHVLGGKKLGVGHAE